MHDQYIPQNAQASIAGLAEPFGPFTPLILLAIITALTWLTTIAMDKFRYRNGRAEFHPDVRVRQKRITGIILAAFFTIVAGAWWIAESNNPFAKPEQGRDTRTQQIGRY